jgi:hypothetical protein
VDDEGGKVGENVDRIARPCLWKPLTSALSVFSLSLFIHAFRPSSIIAGTALAGTRVMNRMSVGGGGTGPVALR